MKNSFIKILLLLFLSYSLIGCTLSSSSQPNIRHWHGKNLHKVAEYKAPTKLPRGTLIHHHAKTLHDMETAQ